VSIVHITEAGVEWVFCTDVADLRHYQSPI
jgi:hypothetical protein